MFLPGIAVNRATADYRGEGKTDAKDAARHRRPGPHAPRPAALHIVDDGVSELRMLTAHRAALVTDRTRAINPLRTELLGIFPARKRGLDLTNQDPVVLVSGFQTPPR